MAVELNKNLEVVNNFMGQLLATIELGSKMQDGDDEGHLQARLGASQPHCAFRYAHFSKCGLQ
eukprot:13616788-Alexandrium_andersonii.AAC.1